MAFGKLNEGIDHELDGLEHVALHQYHDETNKQHRRQLLVQDLAGCLVGTVHTCDGILVACE